jgi:hypothetical protein
MYTLSSRLVLATLREIVWGGMDWIDLAQERPVEDSCEYGDEHSGSLKYCEILE